MRVLLDTNILVSGLLFLKGNEHQILRLIEEDNLTLVLPETVILETKRVLKRRFEGFEELLEIFLSNVKPEVLTLHSILRHAETHQHAVRDRTDLPVYIATLLSRPDYVVTGDKKLSEDLATSEPITRHTRVCSSKEFLRAIQRQSRT